MAVRVGTLLVLSCLVFAPAVAAGEVYKCRMPDGALAFLDHPCPDSATDLPPPKLTAGGAKGATTSAEGIPWGCDQEAASASPADEAAYARMPEAQQEMLSLSMAGIGLGGG